VTRLPAGEPRRCTLCGTEGLSTAADWEVEFARSGTAMMSCTPHLGESAMMTMRSQEADHIIVYDLTRST
jgi:hypothetical protein